MHLGRSALDAVKLMSVGVNYMREHMPSDARVHCALVNAGGSAPNVVQARATVRYLIRGRDLVDLQLDSGALPVMPRLASDPTVMTTTTSSAVACPSDRFLPNLSITIKAR